ncbi:TolC family protein [Spirosoma harenae]
MHRIVLIVVLVLMLVLNSCKVMHSPSTSPPVTVPDTYVGTKTTSDQDSVGIGEQPHNLLFQDSTLIALIDTALVQNLDLKIALQRIEVARATFTMSQGALLPQVDAVATAGVDRYGRYTQNGVGNFDTNLSDNVAGQLRIPNPTPDFFVGFRASWEIDLWGKLRQRRRAAYLRYLASEEGQHLVQTALIADVARLYYTLLGLDGELEIIRENVGLQQRALDLVQIQKTAGRVTELAVQQFQAQLLNTRGLEGRVRQQIVEAENQINLLLGRYPQPIRRGASIRQQSLPATLIAGVPAQLLRRRPDIRQAERELEAAHVDVAASRAEFLPGLTLTPYLGLNAFRPGVLINPASVAIGILGGLVGPVFNRRLLKGNLAISEAQSREAYFAYQRTVLTGVSEVVTSLKGLENYGAVANWQTQEVTILRQAATTSDDLFASNYASYLEVITAQRSVLDAELALMNTKQAQFQSLVGLYRALGGGWK